MTTEDTTPKLLRWKQVSEIIPLSRSYTYALIAQGRFPKSCKLVEGGSGAGWWSHQIYDYMQQRLKASDDE
jgi:predicted DNA-binding transcriptional regulator AlpA|tara:strand:+ start:1086 stop:1298 length:213 start_codon:yes stop_codon:yes gene_type:complete